MSATDFDRPGIRDTGRTTEQMKAAPQGAVFVWCNNHLYYPQKLANHLGRQDLQIVGPCWLENMSNWADRSFTGAVLDHAAWLSEGGRDGFHQLQTRVRVPVVAFSQHQKDMLIYLRDKHGASHVTFCTGGTVRQVSIASLLEGPDRGN